jgi:hypothetical protein
MTSGTGAPQHCNCMTVPVIHSGRSPVFAPAEDAALLPPYVAVRHPPLADLEVRTCYLCTRPLSRLAHRADVSSDRSDERGKRSRQRPGPLHQRWATTELAPEPFVCHTRGRPERPQPTGSVIAAPQVGRLVIFPRRKYVIVTTCRCRTDCHIHPARSAPPRYAAAVDPQGRRHPVHRPRHNVGGRRPTCVASSSLGPVSSMRVDGRRDIRQCLV